MRENGLAAREAELREREKALRESEKALREQQGEYEEECHRKDVMLQKRIQEEAANIRRQRIAIAEQEADVERREAAVAKREADVEKREAAVTKLGAAAVKREGKQPQKGQPCYSDKRRQAEAEAWLMRLYENQYGAPAVMSYSEFASSGSTISGRRMPDFPY